MVAEKAKTRLTPKEERFAQLVARGNTIPDAYREAYKTNVRTAKFTAYRVARRPHVVKRIKELQTPDEKRLFLTRARKREILLEMAESPRATLLERQRAIMIDNRMTGDDRTIVKVDDEITLSRVLAALSSGEALPAPGDEFVDVETSPLPPEPMPAPMPVPQSESGDPDADSAADSAPAAEHEPLFNPFGDDVFTDDPPADPPAPPPPRKRSRSYD